MRTALGLALLLSIPAPAQTPYLVKDINTTNANQGGLKSSAPTEFVALGDKVFFVATTDADGTELWSSDGTGGGTKLVADLVPGTASSSPVLLRAVNGVVVFNARDINHGIELWASDGTAAGTHLLTDINPGPTSSQPGARFVYKNKLLFSADDGTNGRELWVTDGTAAGTKMLADLNPGSASSSPASFTQFGDSVYFFATGGLWKTDGTAAGTVNVSDAFGRLLTTSGSRLFFEAFTPDTGWELWTSDGTGAGTHMVTEIRPGTSGAFDSNYESLGLTPFGNGVLFLANDGVHGREMWFSDGTAAGTHLVRDFVPGAKGMWDFGYAFITSFNGRAYFAATDPVHGPQLWVTDGTDAGTQLFFDQPANYLTAAGGKLMFTAGFDFLAGQPIWVSDGTVGGTRRLDAADKLGINGNTIVSAIFWPVGGKVYFGGFTPLTGTEPWVTDGTDAGTHIVANIGSDRAPSANPGEFTPARDLVFFYATEGTLSPTTNIAESSLWRSDGTAAGTFKLRESGQHPPTLIPGGSYVLFFDDDIGKQRLYRSDGTVAGTQPADDLLHRFDPYKIHDLFPFGDTIFASVEDLGIYEYSLWKMGTAPNAPAIHLGAKNPFGLTAVAGRWVFYAQGPKGVYDYGLWTTDGTPEGTYAIVPDLLNDASSPPKPLVNAGGTVFFLKGSALWKSDGTLDGTGQVKALPAESGFLSEVKAAGRRVFFESGSTLWTSDGTDAGTIPLVKVKFEDFNASNLVPVGSRVVFAQYDNADGWALWGSDGTVTGTKLLLQLARTFPDPRTIDGVVYFNGLDDVHGQELWTTDGTPEATKLFVDLNPGPAGSYPQEFTKAGDTIYFSAYTDTAGRELWALPFADPALSVDDVQTAEGDSGTKPLRFHVSLSTAPTQSVAVDYATSDGTARAGADYDAVSGTLTFAPGETAKTIDVVIHGNTVTEKNRTFFVTLRNARGARLARSEGAGIIDDDDAAADLSVVPVFSDSGSSLSDAVTITNKGPSAAGSIVLKMTSIVGSVSCVVCAIAQLAPGESQLAGGNYGGPPLVQDYLSATATAQQRDPQPSNNAAAWTVNDRKTMAMDAAFLITGATATITAKLVSSGVAPATSDPSIVSLGAVTNVSSSLITFPVTGVAPGTATIAVGQFVKLTVTVVAPGTSPRWPNGISAGLSATAIPFDKPLALTVVQIGSAPISGAKATGIVTVTANGQELARATLGSGTVSVPFYARGVGTMNYTINYAGDANFLPQSSSGSVFVRAGQVTLNATLVAVPGAAGTFTLDVDATGSPVAAPTGTIAVLNGTTEIARVQLAAAGTRSVATTTLTNLPATPALTVLYLGDTNYVAGSQQQVRVVIPRSRAVRH